MKKMLTNEKMPGYFTQFASLFAMLIGLLVLTGWVIDSPILKGVFPGFEYMKANVAISIFCLGLSLWLQKKENGLPQLRLEGRVLAILVTGVGVFTLIEYATGANSGFDQLLFSVPENSMLTHPGRMAVFSAVSLVFMGLALAMLDCEFKSVYPAEVLSILVLCIGFPSILGFLYGYHETLAFASANTKISLPSVFSLMILAGGTLTSRSRRGIIDVFNSQNAGRHVLRSLLPKQIIALIALSLIRLKGQEMGLYGTIPGLIIMVSSSIIICSYFLWRTAKLIHAHDIVMLAHEKKSIQDQFFNVTLDMLGIANIDGFFKRVNPAFQAILGFTPEEILAKPFFEFIHPDDISKTVKEVEKLSQGLPTISFENRYRCKDGSYRWISWKSSPVEDVIYCAGRDITSEKELQAAIVKAKDDAVATTQAKSEFLANMSHEIRTPMNAILGMTDLLLDTPLNSEQKNLAHVVQSSGNNLLSIINDILDFSKIEAGKFELEVIRFNLVSSVEAQADLLGAKAREKDISLLTYIDPHLPSYVLGDPGRIGQILLNFIGNAIKFTKSGNIIVRVVAETTQSQDIQKPQIVFSVQDTGIGISEEAKKRLFLPFSQADSSTARKFGGTGLGLSISKHLIQLMGGEFGVESTEGKGSTFWFRLTLPLAEGEQMENHKKSNFILENGISPKILIVDDDPPSGEIIKSYLTTWQMQPYVSYDGQSALDLLTVQAQNGQQFDLIIIDRRMPGMDGFTLAEKIRENPMVKNIPMILVSAFERAGQKKEALSRGFFSSLAKPLKQSELYNTVLDALRGRPGHDNDLQIEGHVSSERKKRSERILVAEDFTFNQMLILKYLEILGFSAQIVTNGSEVLDAMAKTHFDLILMDCQMPVMDGYEATERIRALEKGGNHRTPIIALTANAMKEDEQKCRDIGMDDFLSKPLRREKLQEMLNRWLPMKA